MPNRFVGRWGSNIKPRGRGSRLEGFFRMRHIDDTHVGVTFIDLRGRPGPEVIATTTNGVPPTIKFSRPDNGETVTYEGELIREQPRPRKSITKGTFVRETALLAAEDGDWTANRPPPIPPGGSGKRGAKKATTGNKASAKKASAKKAAKSQKPVSKKKGSAVKKSARPGKAGKKAR